MIELAPIALSTYIRLVHLKQTIAALQNNTLAKQSDLYVFSDAPQPGDEEKVTKVREYLQTISGFKKIHIIERATNSRVANNRGGIKQLLALYGKVIFLEEDVVTAPGFLEFINNGLKFYKNDKRILSIGAHTPNLESLKHINEDTYIVQRFHPWGFGIWKERYMRIGKLPEFKLIKKDCPTIKQLNKFGNDLIPMVKKEAAGELDALDIRACYHMCANNMFTVLPTTTLVKNIGLDGTGIHCSNNDVYRNDKLSNKKQFNFVENISINQSAVADYKRFYDKLSFFSRLIKKILT